MEVSRGQCTGVSRVVHRGQQGGKQQGSIKGSAKQRSSGSAEDRGQQGGGQVVQQDRGQ